jgi:O-antigen chain-terminating methyltransferase
LSEGGASQRIPDASSGDAEADSPTEATLTELQEKLQEEESVYAELLATLDRLSSSPPPFDRAPELPEYLRSLNDAAAASASSAANDLAAQGEGRPSMVRRLVKKLVEPELAPLRHAADHQRHFDSILVRFLNAFAETVNAVAARHAEFASALVRFTQRIDRLADAKDRLYASLGSSRADLLLEAMDKRLETMRLGLDRARARVEGTRTGLLIAQSRIEALNDATLSERSSATKSNAASAFEPEEYVAFEGRFRGESEELRTRLRDYVRYFEHAEPVVDLGCGRGEFLELLKDAGISARGVDGNERMVAACRSRGLDVVQADIFLHIEELPPEGTGGVFACQVIEHLPPALVRRLLERIHRALRPGGRVVLETVNPRSVVALVETFYRDLTHQKPIHPETLDFLLRAAGFVEVETIYRSPVSERARLLPVSSSGSNAQSQTVTVTLNQNFEKLNAFLFGDQDYACVATK